MGSCSTTAEEWSATGLIEKSLQIAKKRSPGWGADRSRSVGMRLHPPPTPAREAPANQDWKRGKSHRNRKH
jgi:hypothetical protein